MPARANWAGLAGVVRGRRVDSFVDSAVRRRQTCRRSSISSNGFRVSGLDVPAVAELDLNLGPGLPDGCVAVDARVRIARPEITMLTKSW